jgi:hypothetical protein
VERNVFVLIDAGRRCVSLNLRCRIVSDLGVKPSIGARLLVFQDDRVTGRLRAHDIRIVAEEQYWREQDETDRKPDHQLTLARRTIPFN